MWHYRVRNHHCGRAFRNDEIRRQEVWTQAVNINEGTNMNVLLTFRMLSHMRPSPVSNERYRPSSCCKRIFSG